MLKIRFVFLFGVLLGGLMSVAVIVARPRAGRHYDHSSLEKAAAPSATASDRKISQQR